MSEGKIPSEMRMHNRGPNLLVEVKKVYPQKWLSGDSPAENLVFPHLPGDGVEVG